MHRLARQLLIGTLALTALATTATTVALAGDDTPDADLDQAALQVRQIMESNLAYKQQPRMYVAVDKPLYRPGETVWFRAFEQEAVNPASYAYDHEVTFQLLDPRGSVVTEKVVYSQGLVAANDFELDAALAGGAYTIRATSAFGWSTDRPIIVSVYEPPRIKKTLEFVRKAHGPGDLVQATVELERATGEPLANHDVTALVVLDDQELHRLAFSTDENGHVTVRFELPATIERGDGLLTVLVDDGGTTESIQRRIPITVDRIELDVYPEGGDLVSGLDNRVYFQARSPIGKPVDIDAKIVDDTGRVVVEDISTFHNGMGRFELRPEAGRSYELVVTRPTTVKQTVALPGSLASGCTMRAHDDFLSEKDAIEVDVQCTDRQDVVLTSTVRGHVTDATGRTIQAGRKGGKTLSVEPGTAAQGAVRATLFTRDGQPLAERLVYRGLASDVEVTVTADKDSYSPRDPVTLTLEARDGDGNPVQGDFALAVVDDTILSYADDKNAQMLAAMLLLPEMPGQIIDEPNFYFSDDDKAPQAMDLLLGTQGWRRFAW